VFIAVGAFSEKLSNGYVDAELFLSINPAAQAVVDYLHRMSDRFVTELLHLHPAGRAIR